MIAPTGLFAPEGQTNEYRGRLLLASTHNGSFVFRGDFTDGEYLSRGDFLCARTDARGGRAARISTVVRYWQTPRRCARRTLPQRRPTTSVAGRRFAGKSKGLSALDARDYQKNADLACRDRRACALHIGLFNRTVICGHFEAFTRVRAREPSMRNRCDER